MVKCFDNFIGIRGVCDSNPPKSGLYINDLEGINLDLAAKIANINDKTGLELIKRKINFGTELALDDLRAYVRPFLNISHVIGNYSAGKNIPKSYMTPMEGWRGAKVRLVGKNGFEALRINKIGLTTKNEGTATIKVIDGTAETQIHKLELIKETETELELNYVSKTDSVFILVDTTELNVANGVFGAQKASGCNCKGGGGHSTSFSGNNIEITGWNGSSRDPRNYGLTISASTVCSLEEILCSLKDDIKYIVLYKTGIELVKEWLNSRRINEYTTMGADQAAFLLQNWTVEYENKYKVFGENVRDLIQKTGGVCVKCKGVGYGYQI
jgi:hypothetical protein